MVGSEPAAVRERPLSVDGIRSRVLETGPEDASEAVAKLGAAATPKDNPMV